MKNVITMFSKSVAMVGLFSLILGTFFASPLKVEAQAVSGWIVASPSTICSGESSKLSWATSDATDITIEPGIGSVAPTGERDVFPTQTTTYTMKISNSAGGFNQGTAKVTVTGSCGGSGVTPTGNLTPETSSCGIAPGESTCDIYFAWTTNNIPSGQTPAVTKSSNSTVGTGASNSHVPFAVKYSSETFKLWSSLDNSNRVLLDTETVSAHCVSGTFENGKCSTTITPPQGKKPEVDLTADNSSVTSGSSTTIRWITTNVPTFCTASGGTNGWSGYRSADGGSFPTGPITSATTFNITCTNNYGSDSDSVQVTVSNNTPNSPTVNLWADNTSIDSGDDTNLHWTSTNATYCNRTGGTSSWVGNNKPTSGDFNTGDLTSDKTYTITCYNSAGVPASDSEKINVDDNNNNGDDPTVDLRADDTTINFNSSTILRWSSSRADTCRASDGDNGWSGSRNKSGTFNTGRLTEDTTYEITCRNENGSDTDSVTVRVTNQTQTCQDTNAINFRGIAPCVYNIVNAQPTVVVYADSTNLSYNGATTIRWSTTNANSCYASGGSIGWAGVKSIGPGSFYTGSLTGSRTYVLTCTNASGSATDSITVNVRGQTVTTVTTRPAPSSLVLITSSVDRNQPIVPTLDNTNPCPGDEITYNVTYQNIGNASITNLTLRLDLPLEVDYMFSNPNNPVRSGNTLLFSLGTLKANGQGTVTVRVRVRDGIPAGSNLNFPAVLSYTDPSGFPQSVNANVSAEVCGKLLTVDVNPEVLLGANAFWSGDFFPSNLFGWLLLLILILILILLARYLLFPPRVQREVTTTTVNH